MAGANKLMTSGGGGVIITPATNIAADVTVNVPSQNCTLGIQGPAFSAYQNTTQTISAATWTKVTLQAKEFDTNNNFDSTTNYRFTPTVAGYYSISSMVSYTTTVSNIYITVYKNGSAFKTLANALSTSAGISGTSLIYFNGSTDYVELYAYVLAGATTQSNLASTYFQGSLVRAA